jgi:protein-disulfide isomerase
MPSGKRARQQRQQAAARTPPPVRSTGVAGPRQASPRALAIAGGVVGVVVIAIVLGIVLSRGGNKNGGPGFPSTGSCTSAVALTGACDANALFKGIPQGGLVLGKPSARVEMELFIDVQCPICKNYEINYLPTIVQKYVRTGKVQIHLKPWAFIGPQSATGRLGVIAASYQNKAFEYAKVLYDNQPDGSENSGWLDDTMLETIASSVNGLKIQEWLTAKGGSQAQSIASGVDQLAKSSHVTGTPSVFVGKAGGPLHDVMPSGSVNAPDLQITEQALDAAIANS